MGKVNKYVTVGFEVEWKKVPNIKKLSDDFGTDLEDVELVVNGLKKEDGTHDIHVFAKISGEESMTHIYGICDVTQATIDASKGIGNYYNGLVQKILRSDAVDWETVYENLLNSDDDINFDDLDDLEWDDIIED